MNELVRVLRSKRQLVIIAAIALTYAVLLIPFKQFQIVLWITELRPAGVVPVLSGILFGPAAAWGSAIGNLIGDFFGTMTWVSVFGFIGNFFYAYTAHLVWRALVRKNETVVMNVKQVGVFWLASVAASIACAATIAFGGEVLHIVPFLVLFPIILMNNVIWSAALGPPLMMLLYGRIKKAGILY